MTFEVQVMGRDVFVRPSGGNTWRTMCGSDGRSWIELNSDEARMLANALSLTDRFTVTSDEEDG